MITRPMEGCKYSVYQWPCAANTVSYDCYVKVVLANSKSQGNVRDQREDEKMMRLFIMTPPSFTYKDVEDEFSVSLMMMMMMMMSHQLCCLQCSSVHWHCCLPSVTSADLYDPRTAWSYSQSLWPLDNPVSLMVSLTSWQPGLTHNGYDLWITRSHSWWLWPLDNPAVSRWWWPVDSLVSLTMVMTSGQPSLTHGGYGL